MAQTHTDTHTQAHTHALERDYVCSSYTIEIDFLFFACIARLLLRFSAIPSIRRKRMFMGARSLSRALALVCVQNCCLHMQFFSSLLRCARSVHMVYIIEIGAMVLCTWYFFWSLFHLPFVHLCIYLSYMCQCDSCTLFSATVVVECFFFSLLSVCHSQYIWIEMLRVSR